MTDTMSHTLDLGPDDGLLDLFAEELGDASGMQLCTYANASTAASASCPLGCASSFSTFSCECCQGS